MPNSPVNSTWLHDLGPLSYRVRMGQQRRPSKSNVLSLAEAREGRRLLRYRAQMDNVLNSNRTALDRLYATGALFSKEGARAGRDLLLAHQHLLKVVSLLEHLADEGVLPAPRKVMEVEAVYRELDSLLERTSALTHRTGHYLARLQGE